MGTKKHIVVIMFTAIINVGNVNFFTSVAYTSTRESCSNRTIMLLPITSVYCVAFVVYKGVIILYNYSDLYS